MSGWPDPAKPGVPLTPERDGRHWLFDPENNKSYPEIWVAEIAAWAVGDAWTPRMVAEMGLQYQGSVLTPTEADALRAENARLREALIPLKLIADRYDDDGLDEARPSWGGCVPNEILMVQGRGGKAFLTLQQCFDARAALAGEVKP